MPSHSMNWVEFCVISGKKLSNSSFSTGGFIGFTDFTIGSPVFP